MRHYTLFVDESGNFGNIVSGEAFCFQDKRWVVGGILVPLPPEQAAAMVQTCLERVAWRRRKTLDSLPDRVLFHARDLYSALKVGRSKNQAVELLSGFVAEALQSLPEEVHFYAVTNEERVTIAEKDMTYRTMLTDLVTMVDSTLTGVRKPDRLSLIIARRSIDGQVLSSEDAIRSDLNRLKTSLTVGLASQKLINLLGKGKLALHLVKAHENWGLQAADFVVNRVFHREDNTTLLDPLRVAGRLFLGECFRDALERRAYVSWRDGDYVGALYWWSAVPGTERNKYLIEIFRDAYHNAGSDNLRALTGSLIERFVREERAGMSHKQLFEQMLRLVQALESVASSGCLRDHLRPALFQLRTHALLVANHLGSPPEAQQWFALQERQRAEVSMTPENLPLLLNSDMCLIETAVNALDYETALKRASQHRRLIRAYEACWEITAEEVSERADGQRSGQSAFVQSRTYIMAETAYLRLQTLTSGLAMSNITPNMPPPTIAAEFGRLLDLGITHDDRSRVRNHLIAVSLKQEDYTEALRIAQENLQNAPNEFDIFWAARAAADAALGGDWAHTNVIEEILAFLRGAECARLLADLNRHPMELIWRERGLLEHLVNGDRKLAKHFYQRSAELHRHDSAIYRWLATMLTQQKEFAISGGRDLIEMFPENDTACLWLAKQMPDISSPDPMRAALRRARAVTPY